MIASLGRRRGMRQFLKFSVVGASGLAVNLIVFTVLQHFDPHHAQLSHYDVLYTIGFFSGGASNYYLNRVWTFRSTGHALREGAQFLTVSAIAWLVGLVVSYLCAPLLGHGHKLWLVATAAGILVNFFLNKYWTFRHVA
ncbi:MAG TPA: GtrA family protein [Candidatus Dormibacteraeota bacterium]|nr:GtrA family protein [Candidatus Dormibacteraeota bacterium]